MLWTIPRTYPKEEEEEEEEEKAGVPISPK
jgi:hypothetical protein